jgi:hypothetical protein
MLIGDGSTSDATEILSLYVLETAKSIGRISMVSVINDKPVVEDIRLLAIWMVGHDW